MHRKSFVFETNNHLLYLSAHGVAEVNYDCLESGGLQETIQQSGLTSRNHIPHVVCRQKGNGLLQCRFKLKNAGPTLQKIYTLLYECHGSHYHTMWYYLLETLSKMNNSLYIRGSVYMSVIRLCTTLFFIIFPLINSAPDLGNTLLFFLTTLSLFFLTAHKIESHPIILKRG